MGHELNAGSQFPSSSHLVGPTASHSLTMSSLAPACVVNPGAIELRSRDAPPPGERLSPRRPPPAQLHSARVKIGDGLVNRPARLLELRCRAPSFNQVHPALRLGVPRNEDHHEVFVGFVLPI